METILRSESNITTTDHDFNIFKCFKGFYNYKTILYRSSLLATISTGTFLYVLYELFVFFIDFVFKKFLL